MSSWHQMENWKLAEKISNKKKKSCYLPPVGTSCAVMFVVRLCHMFSLLNCLNAKVSYKPDELALFHHRE